MFELSELLAVKKSTVQFIPCLVPSPKNDVTPEECFWEFVSVCVCVSEHRMLKHRYQTARTLLCVKFEDTAQTLFIKYCWFCGVGLSFKSWLSQHLGLIWALMLCNISSFGHNKPLSISLKQVSKWCLHAVTHIPVSLQLFSCKPHQSSCSTQTNPLASTSVS